MSSPSFEIKAKRISDSRGRPTVQATLTVGDISGMGDVPAGASKGEDEARTVDADEAVRNIHEVLAPMMQKAALDLRQHANVVRLDRMMVEKAGANFAHLGANAVVPVSRALWQAAARLQGTELYAYIRQHEPDAIAGPGPVRFFMNIFNGGLHALKKADGEVLGRDRIDIQEVMIVPMSGKSYRDALAMGDKIDQELKAMLAKSFGAAKVTRADEAGFSVKGLGDSSQAIDLVFEAIGRAGFAAGRDVKLALDVAAASFYDKKTRRYQFRGESVDSAALIAFYVDLVKKYPGKVLSIEDGLDENDWSAWPKLSAAMKTHEVITIGDDLFVTQLPRLERGVREQAAHAILIKVNQNGSMVGTLDVMKYAKQHGMQCVISHRSGETLDDSIADLAYATGALGLKTGDPQPEVDFPDRSTWVRRQKYLRMVAIEGHDQHK
ncbi:MAG: phosphopyruvate hydratase [Myxococcota bacterium]